jgi:hypothetical protein
MLGLSVSTQPISFRESMRCLALGMGILLAAGCAVAVFDGLLPMIACAAGAWIAGQAIAQRLPDRRGRCVAGAVLCVSAWLVGMSAIPQQTRSASETFADVARVLDEIAADEARRGGGEGASSERAR